jgi:hypothetical protein
MFQITIVGMTGKCLGLVVMFVLFELICTGDVRLLDMERTRLYSSLADVNRFGVFYRRLFQANDSNDAHANNDEHRPMEHHVEETTCLI